MMGRKDNPYVYFLYSEQQEELRKGIESKMNRIFIPGYVFVKGVKRPYTEMSSNNTSRYPDVKIVAEGYLKDMKYEDIKIVGR